MSRAAGLRLRPLALLLALDCAPLASCQGGGGRSDGSNAAAAGGQDAVAPAAGAGGDPAPQAGSAGTGARGGAAGQLAGGAGGAGAANAGFWSCGTAAGVCTCVGIDTDPGPTSHECGASDCCFLDGDGSCSCRLDGAALDCEQLMTSLDAVTPVAACPP
jgi:hypothetical protein